MSTKDNVSKEWPDPKDYGLPFVELKTLSELKSSAKVKILESKFQDENITKVKSPTINSVELGEKSIPRNISGSTSIKKVEASSSKAWILVVILLFIGVSGVIVWQLTGGNFAGYFSKAKDVGLVENKESNADEIRDNPAPSTLSEDNTLVATDDSLRMNDLVPSVSTTAGTLTLISSKEASPRYFLVYSSLPDEMQLRKMALEIQNNHSEMYLIAPNQISQNYRLAIGKYETWQEASNELNRLEQIYGKDLWILNY